jgi:hypothetical protein
VPSGQCGGGPLLLLYQREPQGPAATGEVPSIVTSVEDKWIEFNDSSIRNFKISDLEEECFGTKEEGGYPGLRFDDEYEGILGKGSKFNIDKCAYILVYDKVEKSKMTFEFDEKTLAEKDSILNCLEKEKAEQATFQKVAEDKYKLEIGFYDLKPFIREELAHEITKDNFKFQVEQYVYSREFMNFVCNLSELKGLADFNPEKIPNRCHEAVLPAESQETLCNLLQLNFTFLLEVFAKSEDNAVH